MAIEKKIVGEPDAFPALVAIHGIVAANDGGDAGLGDFGDGLFEGAEEMATGGGGDVASVGDGVDEKFRGAGLAGDFKEGEKVFEMGVDATIGDEADEVKALARSGRDGLLKNLVFGERAVADG